MQKFEISAQPKEAKLTRTARCAPALRLRHAGTTAGAAPIGPSGGSAAVPRDCISIAAARRAAAAHVLQAAR